ncbi:hypothetical protein NHF46_21810 [Arthrobacter alpinus]|nr:hypothetical protein [Arthrobacter alpinus]
MQTTAMLKWYGRALPFENVTRWTSCFVARGIEIFANPLRRLPH